MSIAAASSLPFGSSRYNLCHSECSTSCGIANTSSWMKHSLDGRKAVDFSSMRMLPFQWLPIGNEPCLSRVSVAADYSDSLPDSSNYISDQGYHPLEELKPCKRTRNTKLTSAEIARTTVEACSSALIVFPGPVHCEPHEQISWAEFQYVVDDYGDIFFEIFDSENILEDRGATSPVLAGLFLSHNKLSSISSNGSRLCKSDFQMLFLPHCLNTTFSSLGALTHRVVEHEILDEALSCDQIFQCRCTFNREEIHLFTYRLACQV